MKREIEKYFAEHRAEMVEDIMSFIRIKSVKDKAGEGMPYGAANAEMLEYAQQYARDLGFETKNYENHVITVQMDGKPLKLDILAHLDVVPADGSAWTVTEPFVPVVKDGRIWGRGAIDDKGPAVAALYAMRAVKELKIPLKGGVRLILGADEENGSSDIEYFYQKEKAAPSTFSPDSDYPLINSEKGGYWSAFEGAFPLTDEEPVISFHGGNLGNAIPAEAQAFVRGVGAENVKRVCAEEEKRTGIICTVSEENGYIRIQAQGRAAHASLPEKGNNAVTGLLAVLEKIIPAGRIGKGSCTETLLGLAKLFPHGCLDGEAAGVKMADPNGSSLTLNLTILDQENGKICGRIDTRTPVCATEENVMNVLKKQFLALGLDLSENRMCPAHYVPEDCELIRKLLNVYEQYTGQPGKCIRTGGMTYTHHVENGVAFGCMFSGTDYHMHGADEFAVIDELILSGEMFAQAIIDICGKEE